jgi:hypothetical protein
MVEFFYFGCKFRTLGTEFVGGGTGGGGGPPPASDLAAPKPARINTSHAHNFNLFTINPFPSVICLKSLPTCLKTRTFMN